MNDSAIKVHMCVFQFSSVNTSDWVVFVNDEWNWFNLTVFGKIMLWTFELY